MNHLDRAAVRRAIADAREAARGESTDDEEHYALIALAEETEAFLDRLTAVLHIGVCQLNAILNAEKTAVNLGIPHLGLTLSLDPLAAHNLAVVLPELSMQAANGTLAAISEQLRPSERVGVDGPPS